MSDKDFWTQAYFEAYKTMLATKGKKLFDGNSSVIDDTSTIISECAFCAEIADTALDYFKINMEYLSKEAKKDIKKKDESKIIYK